MTRIAAGAAALAFVLAGLAPAAAQETITITLANEQPPGHINNVFLVRWKQAVEARTRGQVQIRLLFGGQSYGDVLSLVAGAVQMVSADTARWATVAPEADVFNLPFIVKDTGPAYARAYALGSPVMEEFARALERRAAFQILATFKVGRLVLFSNTPVTTLGLMSGLKVPAIGGRGVEEAMRRIGASLVPAEAAEVQAAFERGAVDGVLGSYVTWNRQFRSSAKYGLDVTGLWAPAYFVGVTTRFWNRVPGDVRKIVADELASVARAQYAQWDVEERAAIVVIQQSGGRMYALAPVEVERWRALVQPVWAEFARRFGGRWIQLMEASQ